MQIPLDYYRILGIPMAASDEQLRQAYSDRIVGLPRREYSSWAIAYRKKLIEEAYVVLSDPKERKEYDRVYLTHAYTPADGRDGGIRVDRTRGTSADIDSKTLGIDISQEELIGALMLLQELGEYEQVLNLGRPYLVNQNGKVPASNGDSSRQPQLSEEQIGQRPDVVLTVALACLELGREQWQQANYENAAVSLETGLELLSNEGLFQSVQAEIQADLNRLRPYRILELLALPLEKTAERQQGLRLLEEVLVARGGIDGTGKDESGLNVDDFLRFIQQLRHYLTCSEQHKLFEQESKRPSAVATYLAVYALIARGFTQRQPALVRQAKQMLLVLGKRQDVHLEQSLCALLLGQTQEATRALELSQEYEALANIRENSQDSPDLLPGLCLYSETWLQNEVFPHFRDLKNQQASLKEYFADDQVQAYLEALPRENQLNQTNKQQNRQPQPNHQNNQNNQNSNVVYRQFNNRRQTPPGYSQKTAANVPSRTANPVTPINETPRSVGPLPTAERFKGNKQTQNGSAPSMTMTTGTPPQVNGRRRRKPPSDISHSGRDVEGTTRAKVPRRRSTTTPSTLQKRTRLLWLIFGSLSGLLVLWLLIGAAVGFLQNIFSPEPTLQGEQLGIQVNQPPIEIPKASSEPMLDNGTLTKVTAQEIVNNWLSIKGQALGESHNIQSLNNILTGTALALWRNIAQQVKQKNNHRTFEHSNLTIEDVVTVPGNNNQAAIEATVTEQARFYQNGKLDERRSYNDSIRVRYMLIKIGSTWRIKEMSVLSTN
ncbi:MAG: IMS domain-containing protein [Cyanobacteriota bacterium]|nr:IMS domain-containing protein [Cyanobacteriota bacterium]